MSSTGIEPVYVCVCVGSVSTCQQHDTKRTKPALKERCALKETRFVFIYLVSSQARRSRFIGDVRIPQEYVIFDLNFHSNV
jgi:hypothetical protein